MKDSPDQPRISSYLERPEFFPGSLTGTSDHNRICREERTIREIEDQVGREYRARGLNSDWARVGLWYEDPFCWLVRDAVVFGGQRVAVHHRLIWKAGPLCGVVVLAHQEGGLVLVRHFRPPLMVSSWECPRGAIEPGETPGQAVRKEVLEELGAEVLDCLPLGAIHPINNWTGSAVNLYWAKVGPAENRAMPEGVLEIRRYTFPEVIDMIREDRITDAPTLCAIAKAQWLGYLPG